MVLEAPNMLPVGAEVEPIPPNGDVTVEDVPKTELALPEAADAPELAPNTDVAPKPLDFGATAVTPLPVAPKTGGLAAPNAGTC